MAQKVPMTCREVQMATLDIIKKIDEICEKLNITYYLMYGSLIGAIRHKGFIPWDDDMDIAMKYPDYIKFLEYCRKKGDEMKPFELHNFETNKNVFYNISRLCDTRYILEFDGMNYTSGTFVDIYPLEGIGKKEDLEFWKRKLKKTPRIQKSIYMCCNKTLFFGKTKLTRVANIPKCVISKILGKKYFFDKLNNYRKIDWNESDYVAVPAWETQYYERCWFDETIRVEFEDIMVSIPKEYDKLLRRSYSDYMKLPPEKDRRASHGYHAYKIM